MAQLDLSSCAKLIPERLHTNAQDSKFGVCIGSGDGTFRAGSLIDTTPASIYSLAVLYANGDTIQVRDI